MVERKWVEGDRLERCEQAEYYTAIVIRVIDGIVLRASNGAVIAGNQKNLSEAGWHLQNAGYNPDDALSPPHE